MRATIESTDKLVTLVVDGHDVPARVWDGVTEGGVPFHCFITRVSVANALPREYHAQFESELREQARARPEIEAIPIRLII